MRGTTMYHRLDQTAILDTDRKSIGSIDMLNIGVRSERQVDTCQPNSTSPNHLAIKVAIINSEEIACVLTVVKVYKGWQLIGL